jgi:ribose transport system permease protein
MTVDSDASKAQASEVILDVERKLGRTILLRQETTLAVVVLVLGALTAWRNPAFLQPENLVEILRSSSIYFVVGCGAAMLIIGGGLDFSVGAVFTLGGLTTTSLVVNGVNWPLSLILGVGVGGLVGLLNHLVITYLHVPPIIATLGVFFVLLGWNAQMTGGSDVLPLPESFRELAQGSLLGVPNIIWCALATGVLFWILLERTRFGVNVRALGGNRPSAIANGLRVSRLDAQLYVIGGATAALAGIIYSSRVGAGQVTAGGATLTLTVITAVLIGGVSLFGGLGTITGVAIGAVLLSLVNNAIILARVPPQYNSMVVGVVLISAVALDHVRRTQLYRRR